MTDHACLSRSVMSALFFDWVVSTASALLDEWNDVARGSKFEPPASAPWWFFNFRMYTQFTIFIVYAIKTSVQAAANDLNWMLSLARSVLVLGILVRHYVVCTRHWVDVANGTLRLHFTRANVFGMFTYCFTSVAAAAVDPYYAGDRSISVAFYASLPMLRIFSIILSKVYAKAYTRTVNGVAIVADINPNTVMTVLITLHFVAFTVCNTSSPFVADRALQSFICTLLCANMIAGYYRRVAASEGHRKQSVVVAVAELSKQEESVGPDAAEPAADMRHRSASIGSVKQLSDDMEKRQAYTECKIMCLLSQVSVTFGLLVVFEFGVSMYIYRLTGTPASWCPPFSFSGAVDRGVQIVFDFFL